MTLTLLATALAAPDDLASKQAEANQVSAEVTSINQQAEQAVERYDEANVMLENTKQKISDNQKELSESSQKLKTAQKRLNERLSEIYRDGNLSLIDVLIDTSNFNDFLARFTLLGKISSQDRDDVEAVLAGKSRVEKSQTELDRTKKQQEDLLGTIASEKDQIQARLAQRQAVLASVQGDIAQMVAQEQQQQWQNGGPPAQSDSSGSSGAAGPVQSGPPPVQSDPSPAPQPPSPPSNPAPPANPAPGPSPPVATPPSTTGGAVAIAMRYLGVPYVWGGHDPATGFDCSGLVMYVYAQMGITLPHSAYAQYYSGTPIGYDQLQPGDLVFFYHPISHVGIYIGRGKMIHAPTDGEVVSIGNVGGPGGAYAGACRL